MFWYTQHALVLSFRHLTAVNITKNGLKHAKSGLWVSVGITQKPVESDDPERTPKFACQMIGWKYIF